MTPDTSLNNHEQDYFQTSHPYLPIIQLMENFLSDKEVDWSTIDRMSEDTRLLANITDLGSLNSTLFDRTRIDAITSRRPVTTFLEYLQKELAVVAKETFHEKVTNYCSSYLTCIKKKE